MDSMEKKKGTLENAITTQMSADTIQRYGAGVKEHLVAYDGVDNESGIQMSKSLKGISQSKVNPDAKSQNLKQQAGYSAEVKATAKENAEKAIRGETNTKTVRTDDMSKQSTGNGEQIGGVNDQLFDLAEVDKNGVYIEGSASQLKFVGGTPKECAQKLLSPKYDKYRDADAKLEVPSDFYDEVKEVLAEEAEKLSKQIERAEKNGNTELANKYKERLARVKKTQANLKKSTVSNREAMWARKHPELSTAVDVVKVSHRAGMETAKNGAIIGGGVSTIRNIVAVVKGDKNPEEAVVDVVIDTGKSAVNGYVIGFGSSVLKGAMQNTSQEYIRVLSKTNLPGAIVTGVIESGKTLLKFVKGDIDGTECLVELGEKGTAGTVAGVGYAVGQAIIPIPVVGGIVGSMIGYALTSAYYNEVVQALQVGKIAEEEYYQVKAECEAAIDAIKEYRAELEVLITQYMIEHTQAFNNALSLIDKAYTAGDVEEFIKGTNHISDKLGSKPLFETKTQFDELMMSPSVIKL